MMILSTLLLALSRPAVAAEPFPESGVYLTAQGGPFVVLREWELGYRARYTDVYPDTGLTWHAGAKIGGQLTERLAVEAGGFYAPVTDTIGGTNTVLSYELDGLFHLTTAETAPYLLLGGGLYHAIDSNLATDGDPKVTVGLGLRSMTLSWLSLRAEARYAFSDGYDMLGSNNLEVRLGVELWPMEIFRPDSDGDGIVDEEDQCISTPGLEEFSGCPDSDGDGIIDGEDTCPQDAGSAELGGCPDGDGDGIADKDDACPEVAGLADFDGCPDSDGDGIIDSEDECPQEAGSAELSGCPDRDRDGVADKDDKCPDVTGLKDYEGCLPDEVKQFTGAIEGIYFQSGKATIQRRSYRILNEAISVMERFEGVRLYVDGHTDSQGDDEANLTLSKERAAAVVAYMTDKGIAPERLQSRGYGETQPVDDNNTRAGRAKNRRIEFKLIEQ